MSNTDRLTDEELREGCSTLGLPVPSLLSRACCELRAARATIAAQEAELEQLRRVADWVADNASDIEWEWFEREMAKYWREMGEKTDAE